MDSRTTWNHSGCCAWNRLSGEREAEKRACGQIASGVTTCCTLSRGLLNKALLCKASGGAQLIIIMQHSCRGSAWKGGWCHDHWCSGSVRTRSLCGLWKRCQHPLKLRGPSHGKAESRRAWTNSIVRRRNLSHDHSKSQGRARAAVL